MTFRRAEWLRRWTARTRPPAGVREMETIWVTLVPSETRTRLLLTRGQDELLRAELPPFSEVKNEQAVTKLLEGLSLWMDQQLCVALYAAEQERSFRLGLLDELYAGTRSVFYAVEPLDTGAPRRPKRIGRTGDF